MRAPSTFLSVDNLEKFYPGTGTQKVGLHSTSFALEKGAFFTLLGPSGCGKTTTLRCIAGLETPDKGTIRVGEITVFDSEAGIDVPMDRRHFGMVFQSYAIWPHMTVFENIAFPLRVAKDRRFSKAEIAKSVGEALDTVGLAGLSERSATRLSGGQQQRVALARAIVRHPHLLLLDEPLSNLDAALREEMRNELRRLQQQIGLTTVYVTHDQSEALELSDRIAVMESGRIVQIDSPRAIYFEPKDAFTAGFVGTTNWLKGHFAGSTLNGEAKVRTSHERIVICARQVGVSEGAPVRIAVRPEAIVIGGEGSGTAHATNWLEGRVVFAGFLGSVTRYQVAVGEEMMQVYGSPRESFEVGDRVTLTFEPQNAIVFA